jgi:hypothetical protein
MLQCNVGVAFNITGHDNRCVCCYMLHNITHPSLHYTAEKLSCTVCGEKRISVDEFQTNCCVDVLNILYDYCL